MKRITSLAILFLLAGACVKAQNPIQVDPDIIAQHLLNHPDPVFPPLARVAHITGNVILKVVIDREGHVTSVHPVSGPSMLLDAAADAVQRYTFTPIQQDGKPADVMTFIAVKFALNGFPKEDDSNESIRFFEVLESCDRQLTQTVPPAAQVDACEKASEQADLFRKNTHLVERRAAYVNYATALIHDNKSAEAVAVGNKAIGFAKQVPNNSYGTSAAYEVTGEALAVAGDLRGADQDLAAAEKLERKQLQMRARPQQKEPDSQTMKTLLQFHAKVLTALGNQKEADLKLKEAATL